MKELLETFPKPTGNIQRDSPCFCVLLCIYFNFQDILDFLSQVFGDTDEVQEIADSVKKLKLSVTPEEVAKLAEDIAKALNSLTGIDDILEETEERLNKANDLKERAEKAR